MTITEFINSPTKTNQNKNVFFSDEAKHFTQKQISGNKQRHMFMKNASISLQDFYFKKGEVDEYEKKGLVASATTTSTKGYRKGGKKQLAVPSTPKLEKDYRRSHSNGNKSESHNYNDQLSTLEACCNLLACCFLWCA